MGSRESEEKQKKTENVGEYTKQPFLIRTRNNGFSNFLWSISGTNSSSFSSGYSLTVTSHDWTTPRSVQQFPSFNLQAYATLFLSAGLSLIRTHHFPWIVVYSLTCCPLKVPQVHHSSPTATYPSRPQRCCGSPPDHCNRANVTISHVARSVQLPRASKLCPHYTVSKKSHELKILYC